VAATAVAADITGKTSLDFVPAQQGSIANSTQQWRRKLRFSLPFFGLGFARFAFAPADRELRELQSYFNPFTTYASDSTRP